MVHHGKREVGPADGAFFRAQASKSLRGRAFMNQVPVNVNERRLARLFPGNVVHPDLLIESFWWPGGSLRVLTLPFCGGNRRGTPQRCGKSGAWGHLGMPF